MNPRVNPPTPRLRWAGLLREAAITLPSFLIVLLWVSARLGDNYFILGLYIILDNIANRLWLRLTEHKSFDSAQDK